MRKIEEMRSFSAEELIIEFTENEDSRLLDGLRSEMANDFVQVGVKFFWKAFILRG